jgi:hypothetical protein
MAAREREIELATVLGWISTARPILRGWPRKGRRGRRGRRSGCLRSRGGHEVKAQNLLHRNQIAAYD